MTNKKRPDLHWLYEASVQNVDTDLDFGKRVYSKHRKRSPLRIREDFCGTAKLAARWVQRSRKNAAWGVDFHQPTLDWGIKYNVSGLDDTVFSDTLFGHRRGAFTGADGVRKGLIEQAAGGTLFLDEIGDLVNPAQVKLLRLLQEGEYYALGSDTPGRSTARIIAATNADLRSAQAEGRFRKDLYYRLMAHHVRIPPLRERSGDVPLLVNHFVRESCALLDLPVPAVPHRLLDALSSYDFPGNVRELQSLIHDAVSQSGGSALPVQYFVDHITAHAGESPKGALPGAASGGPVAAGMQPAGRFWFSEPFPTLGEVESFLMEEALARSDGNQTAAARLLGVSQSTLSRRLSSRA